MSDKNPSDYLLSMKDALERKSQNLSYNIRDLVDCEHEPIAFCGAIQSCGLMIVANSDSLIIEAVSKNWQKILNIETCESLIGQHIYDLISIGDRSQVDSCDKFCALISKHNVFPKLPDQYTGRVSAALCHRNFSKLILEFEIDAETNEDASLKLIKKMISSLGKAQTIEAACQSTADELFAHSGFDRVIIYRFDQVWNGEVIAEAKQPEMAEFIHLKYPASDIPPHVREIFFKNQSRIVADVQAESVPIVSKSISPQDLDLSMSLLRAVSPIHLQYLENMGVRSSMSLPLRVTDKFWGLISFHQCSGPKYPDRQSRDVFDLSARMLAEKLAELKEINKIKIRNEALLFMHSFLDDLALSRDGDLTLKESGARLLSMTSSSTVIVKVGDKKVVAGAPVSPQTLEILSKHLHTQDSLMAWKSDSLMLDLKLAKADPNAAGALAVPLLRNFENFVIWLRPEEAKEVRWGGQPKISTLPMSGAIEKLTPRASFAEWKEKVRFFSRAWSEEDEECAHYFLSAFVQETFGRMQTLSDSYYDLEKEDKAKDAFLSNASHELRTPLSIIIGWIDLLRDNPDHDPEVKNAIDIIDRNAKIQVAMIDDLLDTFRIISGKLRIDIKSNIDVTAVVQRVIEGMAPTARTKNLTIQLQPGEHCLLSADPDRLHQIVWNLVSNAIKFTPDGGEIRVKLSRSISECSIEVEDSGLGIHPSKLERIFNRFVQADNTATKAGGLGIGLSIVKSLTEMHGGTIRAYSEGYGHGSRFVITLPIQQLQEHQPVPLKKLSPAIQSKNLLKGLRILIAEDEPDALQALQLICERNGASVTTAINGEEAMEKLRGQKFDLILSDIAMPRLNGCDLMRLWREEEKLRHIKPIPAIALSAYAATKDKDKGLDAGFTAYLTKPIYREALFSAFKNLHLPTIE